MLLVSESFVMTPVCHDDEMNDVVLLSPVRLVSHMPYPTESVELIRLSLIDDSRPMHDTHGHMDKIVVCGVGVGSFIVKQLCRKRLRSFKLNPE